MMSAYEGVISSMEGEPKTESRDSRRRDVYEGTEAARCLLYSGGSSKMGKTMRSRSSSSSSTDVAGCSAAAVLRERMRDLGMRNTHKKEPRWIRGMRDTQRNPTGYEN